MMTRRFAHRVTIVSPTQVEGDFSSTTKRYDGKGRTAYCVFSKGKTQLAVSPYGIFTTGHEKLYFAPFTCIEKGDGIFKGGERNFIPSLIVCAVYRYPCHVEVEVQHKDA